MSLLDSLLRKRKELKPAETQVTTPDGRVFTERFASNGSTVLTPQEAVCRRHGFVVDTKPDTQIAWVLPGLAMGSQDVAQDSRLLERNAFTHVLSLGVEIPELRGGNSSCENLYVELLDLPETRLVDVLPSCFRFIDEGRSKGRVYVHCNAGVSRSASVVVAFLMRDGKTYKESYDHLKSQRSAIRPNEGFVRQLKDLETTFNSS